ncbi:MAG TPA: flavodoxin family protein [Verrucomicrobiae bacterium]|jgi:NAD(P)H dehydrogenase (quinone)
MPTISIIYFSGSGHTAKLAEAVQKGAASVASVKTHLIAINGDDINKGRYKNDEVFAKLDASDAIIFGSATYMGGPAGQFKTFADATAGKWFGSAWRDKIASGFSVSSSPSGDKFSTLQYFFTLAMQHGMVWVGLGEMPMQPNGVNRLGSFSGAMGQAGQEPTDVAPTDADKLTGEVLGKRVAQFALKLKK